MAPLKLISGNSNPALAQKIAQALECPLTKIEIRRFQDGEIFAEIGESIRGCDVFVVQSTCPPVNDNLMELLIMIDALKRASARSITAVIPYYGYARQDRKVSPRSPITAKLVADILTASGASRIVAMDLHAAQIQGFFDVPFDHLYAAPVLIQHLRHVKSDNWVMVSPDAGGVERARAFAKRLGGGIAIIDKRRIAPNEAVAVNVIGEIKGKDVVILDDMIDTAGTLTQASEVLLSQGALSVIACGTHAVMSGTASERISASVLQKVIVTDTIPLRDHCLNNSKIVVLSVANLLADAIRRVHQCESLSALFV
ncbi:MAG: ribose-phosphate pyrophosphokinase [Deltaproteobacteria bacterium]|nr:ribose-phosphate pyrophosphokinase [Deltaproteobacteria bacterium]